METVILNSLNLTSGGYHIRNISEDLSTENRVNTYIIPRGNVAKIVSDELQPKKILLEGAIIASTKAEMIGLIDALKQSAKTSNSTLTITYGTLTRKYTVNMESFSPSEMGVTSTDYTLSLVANDPVAQSVDQVALSYAGETGNLSEEIVFGGNFEPQPVIAITVNSATSLSKVELTNSASGTTLTIEETIAEDDVLTINFISKKVLLNATEVDFTGAFPEFVAGANTLGITFTSTAHNADIAITYTPRWL